jgi:hypothetical protein
MIRLWMPPGTIMVVLPSSVTATKIASVPFCSPHSMTMPAQRWGV